MRNPFSDSTHADREPAPERAWYEAPREEPLPGAIAPPVKPRRSRWRLIRWAIAGILALFIALVAWLAVTAPLSKSLQPIAPPSITLLDSNGRMFARRGAIVDRPVDVTRLPPHVWQAFVAIEDKRFFHHGAIDPRGIARAAWHNLRAGGVREGGSTITQQLSKLVFLNADRTAGRKLREVMVAFWLEAWLSKQQILSRYLSNVYFGDNVYGLRAAAHHYFGKQPEQLSVSESALLAGLMKAPSKLAPSTNLGGAQARQALVVAAMQSAGFIDAATARAAGPAILHLRPVPAEIGGSWYADWVLPAARDRAGGGYDEQSVQTTLDSRLQRAAAAATAQVGGAMQVALVAMKPDGRVVAMIGGRDYDASSFNRAVQARRQPGSTFKLFVYLAALRAGMTPDDRIADTPLTIDGWSPANADRHYQPTITLRDAFARSSNVAAVRLAQKVGADQVVRAARDLGVISPLTTDPTLPLGTSGMTLLELTRAYAAVAANALSGGAARPARSARRLDRQAVGLAPSQSRCPACRTARPALGHREAGHRPRRRIEHAGVRQDGNDAGQSRRDLRRLRRRARHRGVDRARRQQAAARHGRRRTARADLAHVHGAGDRCHAIRPEGAQGGRSRRLLARPRCDLRQHQLRDRHRQGRPQDHDRAAHARASTRR